MANLQSRAFTAAGAFTFNVPLGVSCVWVSAGGGGASGGPGQNNPTGQGPGGGAGEQVFNHPYIVTPGGTVAGVIGAGGVHASTITIQGGGDTTFGTLRARGAPNRPVGSPSQPGLGGGPGGGGNQGQVGPVGLSGLIEGLAQVGGAMGMSPPTIAPPFTSVITGAGSYTGGGVWSYPGSPPPPYASSGPGGPSTFGFGGDGVLADQTGSNGHGYGSGGGGGSGPISGPAIQPGGDGVSGYCAVFWVS